MSGETTMDCFKDLFLNKFISLKKKKKKFNIKTKCYFVATCVAASISPYFDPLSAILTADLWRVKQLNPNYSMCITQ